MSDFAGAVTLLIFLFYLALAGLFVAGGIRKWIWPVLKSCFPHRDWQEHGTRVHCPSRDHSPS